MAYSFQDYTGDGATTLWSVPFSFLDRAHVDVIDLADDSAISFSWISDSQISITPAVLGTVTFRIRRLSNHTARLVDFQDATNLNESILDLSANQNFYMAQEVIDDSNENVAVPNSSFSGMRLPAPGARRALVWNAGGTGLEVSTYDPDQAQTDASASAAAASASAAAAATSETNAGTSETNAAASEALAQDWATETTALVEATDNSAKAYAIGGTGAGQPTGGDAKSWAQKTSAAVTGSLYSAKEWALGILTRGVAGGGSAKDWATYTAATVDNAEYSAKNYAYGTLAGIAGSAKDWAQKTGAAVTGSLYSAKEWAVGTFTRGSAGGGSAKDWATYTAGLVDDTGRSAKYWAEQSAAAWDQVGPNALCPFENLRLTTGASLTTLTVTADKLELVNASGDRKVLTTWSGTLDITASGALGLDTGSETPTTWYYVWAIAKEDGTKSFVFSTSSSAPTLPTGYTYYGLVGAVRNNGAGNFNRMAQVGALVGQELSTVLSGGNSSTQNPAASIDVSGVIPVEASALIYYMAQTNNSGGALTMHGNINTVSSNMTIRTGSQTGGGYAANAHNHYMSGVIPMLNSSQTVWYYVGVSTWSMNLNTIGYYW